MRATRLTAAVFLGLAAGACATVTPEEQRRADESRCISYGFHRGTDAFSKCLQDIDLDRSADRRADRIYDYPVYGPGWGPRLRRW
jgi:hypothetical protein